MPLIKAASRLAGASNALLKQALPASAAAVSTSGCGVRLGKRVRGMQGL